MAAHDEKGVIRALIAGVTANFFIGVTKSVAFFFTSSSAMLAEALHSFADSGNQALLFVGLKRSKRAPSAAHPLGYSKESYFWAFIVAILIFTVGAVFSIYEGIHKVRHPEPITNPMWSYVALSIGLILEARALMIAWEEFKHFRAENPGPLLEGLSQTKDPILPTVLFEDGAALLGLLVALFGVSAAVITGNSMWDGAASITIGVLLLGVAWFLARESHSLIIGEAALERDYLRIAEICDNDEAVVETIEIITLHRGPKDLLVALNLNFQRGLTTKDIEAAVVRIETSILESIPIAKNVFIEAGAARTTQPTE